MESTDNFEFPYVVNFFSEVENFLEKIEFEQKISETMDLLYFPLCLQGNVKGNQRELKGKSSKSKVSEIFFQTRFFLRNFQPLKKIVLCRKLQNYA